MKNKIAIVLCFLLLAFSVGCGAKEKQGNDMYVYYVNADGNALMEEVFPAMDIEEALHKIQNLSVFPVKLEITEFKQNGNCQEIYFNENYLQMSKGSEVLLRAAVVKTLVQIEGVEYVSFFVGDKPLADQEGNPVGMMNAESFVQNTGSSVNSYQTTDLVLYFSDKDGTTLKEVRKSDVRYNANTSIEKLVVEQLMKGTSSSSAQSTIPKTTKLLGISVKEGICYVNFDSKFVQDSYDLNPEVAIYSIVHSIIANGTVSQVQILIDGASDVVYKNSVDLSRALEWKADLIKE